MTFSWMSSSPKHDTIPRVSNLYCFYVKNPAQTVLHYGIVQEVSKLVFECLIRILIISYFSHIELWLPVGGGVRGFLNASLYRRSYTMKINFTEAKLDGENPKNYSKKRSHILTCFN